MPEAFYARKFSPHAWRRPERGRVGVKNRSHSLFRAVGGLRPY
ncbi:hypothetical protein D1BOALGB6SA_8795 [Olavius sp. associated proteobacterium Delta 1]|nr:hypothetical protein D1BOALGB6SA_8795 [Olavius sp. associated proteobacterium Delta 1]